MRARSLDDDGQAMMFWASWFEWRRAPGDISPLISYWNDGHGDPTENWTLGHRYCGVPDDRPAWIRHFRVVADVTPEAWDPRSEARPSQTAAGRAAAGYSEKPVKPQGWGQIRLIYRIFMFRS